MDRPQLIRRLRIAVSVFFAVAAVALCALWVRSCWWADEFWVPLPFEQDVGFTSIDACVSVAIIRRDFRPVYYFGWSSKPDQHLKHRPQIRNPLPPSAHGFRIARNHDYLLAYLNDSFLLLTLLGCTSLPWLSLRFSLRTLLIATTLVAVVLGLGVWAVP